nr:proteoglycan 4-like [Penaeus vannamei]
MLRNPRSDLPSGGAGRQILRQGKSAGFRGPALKEARQDQGRGAGAARSDWISRTLPFFTKSKSEIGLRLSDMIKGKIDLGTELVLYGGFTRTVDTRYGAGASGHTWNEPAPGKRTTTRQERPPKNDHPPSDTAITTTRKNDHPRTHLPLRTTPPNHLRNATSHHPQKKHDAKPPPHPQDDHPQTRPKNDTPRTERPPQERPPPRTTAPRTTHPKKRPPPKTPAPRTDHPLERPPPRTTTP